MSGSPIASRLRRGAAAGATYSVVTRVSALVIVPIALHGLTTQLYAVWVIANVIVSSQGLLDLGAAPAVTRYVAVAAPAGDRQLILRVVRLAATIYGALSLLVLAVVAVGGATLVREIGASPGELHDARWLLLAGAVSFGVSNVQAVLVALLTGMNQAHRAYVALTIGQVVYLAGIAAAGLSGHTLIGLVLAGPLLFGIQVAIMLPLSLSALRKVPHTAPADREVPRTRDLLSYGVSMQTASLADFGMLQVPRLVSAFALSAASTVSLDIALRVGSTLAGTITMTQTAVLPALAWVRSNEGETEFRRLARRMFDGLLAGGAVVMLILIVSVAPALGVWLGHGREALAFPAVAVSIGMVAHGLTAPLTAAVQVRGEVREIVWLKLRILALLVVLLVPATSWGVDGFAVAIAVSVLIPSVVFSVRELRGPLRGAYRIGSDARVVVPFVAAAAVVALVRLGAQPPNWVALTVAAGAFAVPVLRLATRYRTGALTPGVPSGHA